jgi:hypothetical protein
MAMPESVHNFRPAAGKPDHWQAVRH